MHSCAQRSAFECESTDSVLAQIKWWFLAEGSRVPPISLLEQPYFHLQ